MRSSGPRSFNSRAPWGARRRNGPSMGDERCFNSRAPWGARPRPPGEDGNRGVSIHAPRGGRDTDARVGRSGKRVSIHAPRGGRDARVEWKSQTSSTFQFTRPVGGATRGGHTSQDRRCFNSRAPWGARRRRVYHKRGSGFNGDVPRTRLPNGLCSFIKEQLIATRDGHAAGCEIRERPRKRPFAWGSRKTRGAGAVRRREPVWPRRARCASSTCRRGCSSEGCRSRGRRCPPARP